MEKIKNRLLCVIEKLIEESFNLLIKLLLPSYIIDHFELKIIDKQDEILHLNLEGKNNVPSEYSKDLLQSKGFELKLPYCF